MKGVGERTDILSEFVEKPRVVRVLIGVIGASLLSCYASIAVLAIFWGAQGLFAQVTLNLSLCAISALGALLWLQWPSLRFLKWLPAVLLFWAQAVIVVIAKPMGEWIYGAPSFLYSVGTPVLTLVLFEGYAKRVDLVSKPSTSPAATGGPPRG